MPICCAIECHGLASVVPASFPSGFVTVSIILPIHIFNRIYFIWRYINSLEKWDHFRMISIIGCGHKPSPSDPTHQFSISLSFSCSVPDLGVRGIQTGHALSNWKRNGGKNYERCYCLSMPFASWNVLFQNRLCCTLGLIQCI